jgi:hypothetical protein
VMSESRSRSYVWSLVDTVLAVERVDGCEKRAFKWSIGS